MKKIIIISFIFVFAGCATTKTAVRDYRNIEIPEGKAIIYILRPVFLEFSVVGGIGSRKIPHKVFCNDSLIGSTLPNRYIFTILEPGSYTLMSKSENESKLEIQVESDKIYYVEQNAEIGLIFGRSKLKLLSEEEGKEELSKCKISKNFTPPDLS